MQVACGMLKHQIPVLCAIEKEVRQCLKMLLIGSGYKAAIVETVVESKEVQFLRLIVQADFNIRHDKTYLLLLHKIVEVYVTVRRYSYTSDLMENTSK